MHLEFRQPFLSERNLVIENTIIKKYFFHYGAIKIRLYILQSWKIAFCSLQPAKFDWINLHL